MYNNVVKNIASELGLSIIGTISKGKISQILKTQKPFLEEWQAKKMYGEMDFMARDSNIFTDLSNILEDYESVISLFIPYYQGIPDNFSEEWKASILSGEPPKGYGKVARYAWGLDYHKVIKKKLKLFTKLISERIDDKFSVREFTDSVPMLERAIAASAGLGFIGKNSLLIRKKLGSFGFLAEVICSLQLDDCGTDASNIKKDNESLLSIIPNTKPGSGCSTCTRCINNCPTDAIINPGVLDARKCIAYMTIEKRSEFNDFESSGVGNWVFGCDICQDVCPFNHKGIPKTQIKEFYPEFGAGPFLELESILAIENHEQFVERFAGTAIMRAKREGLVRNALAVILNQNLKGLVPKIEQLVKKDESTLIRSMASFVLEKL